MGLGIKLTVWRIITQRTMLFLASDVDVSLNGLVYKKVLIRSEQAREMIVLL